MRFFNNGKGKGPKHDGDESQSGPPNFDVPGFMVALAAGGRPPFLDGFGEDDGMDDIYPEPPVDDYDWEEPELM
ncbi:MAG: hypothetical protein ABJM29_08775 [Rhizobiaceae bacterium]